MISALAVALAASLTFENAYGVEVGPPETRAIFRSVDGLFVPGLCAEGYFLGGPRSRAKGLAVGASQVGLDIAALALGFALAESNPQMCRNFECPSEGLAGSLVLYLLVNTVFTAWSAYDVYWTVKLDPALSTPGPIR